MELQHLLTEAEIAQSLKDLETRLRWQNILHTEWYNQYVLPIENEHAGERAILCKHGIIKIGTESKICVKPDDITCGCTGFFIAEIPLRYNREAPEPDLLTAQMRSELGAE